MRRITLQICFFLLAAFTASSTLRAQQSNQDRINIGETFQATGWMGDGEYGRKFLQFSGADTTFPRSKRTSMKISYAFGDTRWAGIYWQNTADNWGEKPGNNYARAGISKLTFWARGTSGSEIVEFKVGGISRGSKKYRDSLEVSTGRIELGTEWKKYTIDLKGRDLSSVIGGFCWVASADYNPTRQIIFFLDEILLE